MPAPPIWALAIPLPAVLIITLSLYLVLLGVAFWLRACLKERCSSWCEGCCPDISPASEQCCRLVHMCDCKVPSVNSCWARDCPRSPCVNWDCACTCQPPECDSCNCFCFEIRVR